jgi:hypothetical protein
MRDVRGVLPKRQGFGKISHAAWWCPAVSQHRTTVATKRPYFKRALRRKEDAMMTVTHTLTTALLVTGTLTFYLVGHAAIDVLRQMWQRDTTRR